MHLISNCPQDYKLFRIVTWITLLTSTYLVFWFPHEVEHGRMPSNFLIETVYRLVDKVIFSTTLAWAIYSTSFGYSRTYLLAVFYAVDHPSRLTDR